MKNHYTFILIITIISLLGPASIKAQEDDYGVIFWSKDRDLEWSDFKGESLVDSFTNFYLDLYIQSVNINEMDSYILFGSKPEAYVYSNTSYVDEELKTDDLLRYLNVYFDMAGYYAYRLDKGLHDARKSDNITIKSNPDIIRKSIVEEWRTESTRLALETEYGLQIEKLLIWEDEIEKKVSSVKEPTIHISDYSFGFDFQVGAPVTSSKYLKKEAKAVIGLEITKDPYIFSFAATLGQQKVLNTITEDDDTFPIDSEPSINTILLNGGYSVFENHRFRIIPRVGIHFTQLRYPSDSDLTSINWSAHLSTGCTADIKLLKWKSKSYNQPELSDISLRLSAFYYPMDVGVANLSHGILSAGFLWTIGGGSIGY